jgi:peptide/nickel transport system substrate-binding protein
MKHLSKILALLLALAMVLSLAACGGSASSTDTTDNNTSDSSSDNQSTELEEGSGTTDADATYERKTEEGTLTVGTYLDQGGLDPVDSGNTCGLWLVYEQLLQMDANTGAYEPLLAESYEYVDDTHIHFTLRSDATFSDGTPVTSNDVLVSWKHFIESESQWIYYMNWIDIDNFVIEDDLNFIVALNDSYTFAEAYLCNRYASVMSAAWIESASDEDWWTGAVASGPYICTENVSGSYATFERNPNYWNAEKTPEADKVTVRYYTSTATMMVDYESGALDIALDIDGTDAERVLSGSVEGTNYDLKSRSDVYTLALPEYVEGFSDIRVRQAISLAIDADAVCEAGLSVLGKAATSILPSDCNYYIDTSSLGATGYDPDQAKELLEEAGFVQDHPFVFVVPNYDYNCKMAEAIEAYLEQVGIQIDLVEADLVTCITQYFMTGSAEMVINSCGAANHCADQQLNTSYSFSTNGTVAISDETYNSYVEVSRTSTDEDAVQEAYTAMQTWMAENCRQISLAEPMVMNVYHSYIKAINSPVYDYNYLRYVEFA